MLRSLPLHRGWPIKYALNIDRKYGKYEQNEQSNKREAGTEQTTKPETRRNKFIPFRFARKSLRNSVWVSIKFMEALHLLPIQIQTYIFVFHSRAFAWFSQQSSWYQTGGGKMTEFTHSDAHTRTHAAYIGMQADNTIERNAMGSRGEIILLVLFWCDVRKIIRHTKYTQHIIQIRFVEPTDFLSLSYSYAWMTNVLCTLGYQLQNVIIFKF